MAQAERGIRCGNHDGEVRHVSLAEIFRCFERSHREEEERAEGASMVSGRRRQEGGTS